VVLEQDNNYAVAICISGWNDIPEAESINFLTPINDVRIMLRVIKAPTYIKKD
jgi:hypothetical protein